MKYTPKKPKAPSSKLQALLAALLAGLASASPASVPLRWTVETSRVSPAVWGAYHGETLALEASLQSYGRPLAATNQEVCIYWQTNGMGTAYWSAPAWASNNVLRADFTPAMDPGAPVVNGFVGSPGDIYRASFQLRFRPSPGAVPNVLPLPVPTLDFATVAVLNPPYYTQEETDAKIVELAPAPGNYAAVSNAAMNAASAYKGEPELVSCAWQVTGLAESVKLLPMDGANAHWKKNINSTVIELAYDGAWLYRRYVVRLGGQPPDWQYTNTSSRAATILTFDGAPLVRCDEVWGGTNYYPVAYSDDLATVALAATNHTAASLDSFAATGTVANAFSADTLYDSTHTSTYTADDFATTEDLASATDAADAALAYAQGSYLYMLGNTNAWFEGTNYVVDASNDPAKVKFSIEDGMDLLSMPCSMSLWENHDGARRAVWDQRDWTAWYWSFKAAQWTNAVAAAMHTLETNTMRRGWSKYTAVNGLDNPDPSTLHVDTPNITLSPGAEWQKTVEVRGTGYWTIQGNGLTIGPEITTNGAFLTIKDFEGNAALTIRKTASQLVWATREDFSPGSYRDNQDRVVFTLASDTCPIAEFSTTLYDADFVEETDPDVPADFEWTGSSGAWQCHFLLKSGINSQTCFARFKILQEGENVVEHHIPLKISGGISFEQGGTSYKIKPVVNGSTVTWQLVN